MQDIQKILGLHEKYEYHIQILTQVKFYSTGVQIVSCTLSDDSVLSESTGLFNPVLCVSQWNIFWQKNQPMR